MLFWQVMMVVIFKWTDIIGNLLNIIQVTLAGGDGWSQNSNIQDRQ